MENDEWGKGIEPHKWVEISPATDQWMKGHRKAKVLKIRDGVASVELDITHKVWKMPVEYFRRTDWKSLTGI